MKEQFSIRIEPKSKEKIAQIAKKNSRTLSGQIEFIINSAISDWEKINGKIEAND